MTDDGGGAMMRRTAAAATSMSLLFGRCRCCRCSGRGESFGEADGYVVVVAEEKTREWSCARRNAASSSTS